MGLVQSTTDRGSIKSGVIPTVRSHWLPKPVGTVQDCCSVSTLLALQRLPRHHSTNQTHRSRKRRQNVERAGLPDTAGSGALESPNRLSDARCS